MVDAFRTSVRRNEQPAGRSGEESKMRECIAAWGRKRWPDARVLHELCLGERRIDMLFVRERDIIGFEIKSSRDRLDRLRAQMVEYSRYVPEVWLAVAPRWSDHDEAHRWGNRVIVDAAAGSVDADGAWPPARRAHRDELSINRLLELLWREEAARIAQRTDVIPGAVPTREPLRKILPMLSRLLTGNDILREVCAELRSRPFVGIGSDAARSRERK